MANEEKILETLAALQRDVSRMQAEINGIKARERERDLKDLETRCGTIDEQKAAWHKMSNLLTKEEGDALAAAIGE